MKRPFALLLLLIAAPAVWAADDASAEVKPPQGFKALFNGKDLTGWKGLVASPPKRAAMSAEELAAEQKKADASMNEHWSVEDGVLVYDGKGQSLCTAKDYADFEMYVDWKILSDGDSGIYVRGSPQIQIWDPAHWKVGSGGLYNNKEHQSAPTIIADNPIGEWNTFYIKMVGDRVTVKLNGKTVTDNVVLENYWERDKPIYPTGQIELQHHGNRLEFKNIYIRELVSPDQLKKMEEAAPAKATATPKKDQNVLVFLRHAGFRHSSIPVGGRAVQIIGDKNGAYSSVITDDLTDLWPENLTRYDAVVMVNTTGEWIKPRAEDLQQIEAKYGEKLSAADAEAKLKKSLLNFVSSGKGLVGFHAASDANYQWPEFGEMVGGYFNAHPWHEKVGVKVDSPQHPLMAAFGGKDFTIVDEIYQFRDPYSRKALHVLLSLDVEKTNMDKKNIKRDDGDFAVSWVRSWGDGRVFYSSLGHREEIYWNPQMLAFYLDGIQFALGDLDADTTPSAN
ncbi:family 16 glycoside hydrolase [Blastopirellula retiformator]|uniref:Trehalose utilization n=1 Tax=Blastopirellula retiformator TaxID=2527970 RepID=A0A5C5VLK7_9BACT|nr:family 16 glycoside hydrolase [Blastopirellula retiformator]TWT38830.1 Trehalose utilization [Blastopirellula retiformator]